MSRDKKQLLVDLLIVPITFAAFVGITVGEPRASAVELAGYSAVAVSVCAVLSVVPYARYRRRVGRPVSFDRYLPKEE